MTIDQGIMIGVTLFFFAAIAVEIVKRFWRRGEARTWEFEQIVGAAGPCKVCIASHEGRRFVEVAIHHSDSDSDFDLQAYLTPGEARRMAGWLRLAARADV